MKYLVAPKGARPLLIPSVLYNAIIIIAIVMTSIDSQKEAKYVLWLFIAAFIMNNITMTYMYIQCLSMVRFQDDMVKCTFMGRVRRRIAYDEVVEYDAVWIRGVQYIYLTRMEMTDYQREHKVFDLYRKTKDVIVLQYHEEVEEYLKGKGCIKYQEPKQ